ncbi:MAG: hypothetical protein ABSF23_14995 [Terracidiphilus sp.]|jgi:hypothetical protein
MTHHRPFRIVKFFLFGLLAVAVLALLAWVVMSLWNCLMPALFGLKIIGYWQAIGLMLLFRLLFGGFGAPRGHGPWRGRMRERWEQMTPEDREKFRERMRACCGPVPPSDPTPAA